MRFDLNNWNEIYQTLAKNKARTFLTAFGVFWGIFMLVLLMGLGAGLKEIMSGNFKGVSQNMCVVMASQTSKPYKGFQRGRTWSLENKDVPMLIDQISDIKTICSVVWAGNANAVYGELTANANILGVSSTYTECENPEMIYGRYINEIDDREGRKNCVIGDQIYNKLFPKGGDPTGKYINIKNVYFQIIGVTKGESKLNMGGSQTERVTIPITTAQTLYNMGNKINFLMINAKSTSTIKDLQFKVEQILKAAHFVAPNDDKAIFFLNTGAMFGMINSLLDNINKIIWIVGLGTLLAGIIGVSNIMLITVKERTSEFGIRRAIGALPTDILGQILSESIVITIISGLLGLSFGTLCLSGVEYVVNMIKQMDINFQISFGMSIAIIAILILLGIIAGAGPAYRAMSIKPIDAIRDE